MTDTVSMYLRLNFVYLKLKSKIHDIKRFVTLICTSVDILFYILTLELLHATPVASSGIHIPATLFLTFEGSTVPLTLVILA